MIPLETNQKVLTLLFVHLSNKTDNIWRKCAHIIFTITVLILHLFTIVSSAVYFSQFMSTDMGSALFGILQIGGHVNMAYMLITALILRQKFSTIFEKLETIYKICKSNF